MVLCTATLYCRPSPRVRRAARVVAEQRVEQQRHVLRRKQLLHRLALTLVDKNLGVRGSDGQGHWLHSSLQHNTGVVCTPAAHCSTSRSTQRLTQRMYLTPVHTAALLSTHSTAHQSQSRLTSTSRSTLRFTPRMYLTPLLRAACGPPFAISFAMKSE